MYHNFKRYCLAAVIAAASLTPLGSVAANADQAPFKVQPAISRTNLGKGDQVSPHDCWSNLEQRDGKVQVALQTRTSPTWDTAAGISLVLPQGLKRDDLDKSGPIEITFQGPSEIPMYGDALKDHPYSRFNLAGFHVRAAVSGWSTFDHALTVAEDSGQPEQYTMVKHNGDGTYTLTIGGDVLRSLYPTHTTIVRFSFYMTGKRASGFQPEPTNGGWQPIRAYIKSVKVCGKNVDFLANMKDDKNSLLFN